MASVFPLTSLYKRHNLGTLNKDAPTHLRNGAQTLPLELLQKKGNFKATRRFFSGLHQSGPSSLGFPLQRTTFVRAALKKRVGACPGPSWATGRYVLALATHAGHCDGRWVRETKARTLRLLVCLFVCLYVCLIE